MKFVAPRPPMPEATVPFLKESYDSEHFANYGPAVLQYQRELKRYFNWERECLAVNNATQALTVALKAAGVKNGGLVGVPTFTFAATAFSIEAAGCVPVFVDSTSVGDLDLDSISEELDALVVVEPLGYLVRNPFKYHEYGVNRSIPVIFDAAACLGAPDGIQGHTKDFSAIEIFSLHITKTLGIGEGGLIVADEELVARAKKASNFGFDENKMVTDWGTNSKMSDFQAAFGLAVLQEAPRILKMKEEVHALYLKHLSEYALRTGPQGYQLFPVLHYKRDEVQKALADIGVPGLTYYKPLHLMPYFSKYAKGSYPMAEHLGRHILCLPVHHQVTEKVVEQIREIMERFDD